MKKLVPVLCSLLAVSINPASGNSPSDPAISYFVKEADARMIMTTDLPEFPNDQKTIVKTSIDPKSGKVLEAKIKKSCGVKTLDFSCLESAYAIAPLKVRTATEKYNLELSFPPREYQANRSLPKETYLIHVVPLTASFLYPEIYSKEELQKVSNIAVINSPEREEKLKNLYQDWFTFFGSHKTTSRESIEKQANALFKKYKLESQEKVR